MGHDHAARFRKMGRSLSLTKDRETMAEYAAALEREANQLEAEVAVMDGLG
jgi:DNA-binding transcriptional LysR family regulator